MLNIQRDELRFKEVKNIYLEVFVLFLGAAVFLAFDGFTGDSSVWVAVTVFAGEASTLAFFLEARAAGLEVSAFGAGDFLAAAVFPRPKSKFLNN